jgi:uncharacterized cupin superfamily protein
VKGRLKHKLGDLFGLSNFGVNLTELTPGAYSSVAHHHSKQDEFIYVVQGTLTLLFGSDTLTLQAGDCFGFKAGSGIAHQLVNRSTASVSYLEIGDRSEDDMCEYPNDDLKAQALANGAWAIAHKDGRPY